MARYDGSLKFDTNIDSAGFNTGVKNLTSGFEKIGKNVNNLANKFNMLNNVIKLVSSTIAIAFVTKGIKESILAAEEYQNAMTGLKSIMDGQGKSFSTAEKFIKSYTSDGLVTATEATTAYKNLALRGYDTSQIEKVMIALKDSATYSRQASYGLGEAVATAAEGLKNENSVVVDNAGVTKNVAKMWEDYAKSIGKTTNNLTQAEKIKAEVTGILEETKFQKGDAATYVNSYSGMIARLNASFTTLKQTLGSAFMQIFQAVLPVIQSVINALVQLASIFASLVNSVFGKFAPVNKDTAKSSKSATKAIEKQGNATEKAGKQAEGALLSFDKLNVLDKNKSSGASSGGGTNADIPEISVENTGTTLADELQNAFEGMSAYEIGFSIAEKINEALSNIDWSSIQIQAQNIAYNLAMFLNGAVAGLDWYLLGYNIAEAINTALIFAYTWLTTFDFTKFGIGLANGLNGAIHNIKWDLLGKTIGAYIQSSFNTLYGFVTTFNWKDLGTSIAKSIQNCFNEIKWDTISSGLAHGINGVFTTLNEIIKNIQWIEIALTLSESVNKWFDEVDWGFAAQTLSDGINALLDSVIIFLGTLDWGSIGSSIGEFIGNIDWIGIVEKLSLIVVEIFGGLGIAIVEGVFSGISEIAKNTREFMRENVFEPLINAFKELFGIHSPSFYNSRIV